MFTEMAQGFESSLSYYTTSSVVDDPAQSKGACGDSKPIMDTSGSHFGVSSCWGGCMEQAVIAAEALTGKQMIVKMESSKNI